MAKVPHSRKTASVSAVTASTPGKTSTLITPSPALTSDNRLVFGLWLVSLLTPLVFRTDVFFGYTSVKTLFFEGVVTLMALASLISLAAGDRLNSLDWAVVGWLAVLGLTSALGVDPEMSFWSSFSRMEGFWTYAYLGLYFWLLSRARFSSRQWTVGLMMSVLVAVAVVLVGGLLKNGWQADDKRLMATVGNASFLAIYLLLHLFVAVLVTVRYTSLPIIPRLAILVVAEVVLAIGIILTGARSAVLAGGIGIIVFSIVLTVWAIRRQPKIVIGLLMGTAVLGGIYTLLATVESFQRIPGVYRLTHVQGQFGTLSARQGSWEIATDAIMARPVLGWGMGNYSYGFALHYKPAFVLQGLPWYDRVHNMPLEWAFGGGVVGLLTSLVLWILLLVQLHRRTGISFVQKGILVGGMAAYFFFNLLNPDNLLSLQFFFIVLAFVSTKSGQPDAETHRKLPLWGRLVIAGVLLVGSYWTVYIPTQTLSLLNQQQTLADPRQRLDLLERAYNEATVGKMDVADHVVTLALAALNDPGFPPEGKAYSYEKALKMWGEVCEERPLFTRAAARLAALRLAHNDYPEAFRIYQDALTKERGQRPELLLQLGSAYLQKGDFSAAMEAFQRAGNLVPSWETPIVHQALAFAVHREPARSDSLLRRVSDANILENLALVKQVYGIGGNPHGFVDRIMAVKYKHQFAPSVYMEWATSAFALRDETALRTSLNAFARHYGAQYDYAIIQQIIDDALLRNVSPAEALQGLIARLK